MKKVIFFIALLSIIGIGSASVVHYLTENKKNTVYIALAGPMSGFSREEGRAMLRGATLAYEQVKSEGNILKDTNVEIIPYDDQNSQTAVRIASDIVDEDKVLIVLGHYSSSGSAAAGPIYQRNGIPAITASATMESATFENEWFFRTVPGNHDMAEFVARNIKYLPGITTKTSSMIYNVKEEGVTVLAVQSTHNLDEITSKAASIIYDSSYCEPSIAEEFYENTKKIFKKVKIWSFDSKSDSKNNDIKKIIGEIRANQSVGPIFFATSSEDTGEIISSFRYPGTDYPVIGSASLAIPTFIRQFESYPKERERPGYYTNETYAVSPFISYLADQPNALAFREEFFRRYNKEPSWVAASYYDAMLLVLNALERAEIQKEKNREDRRRIRNALNRFNEKDVAVKGVTGDLYFDEHGNINPKLSLGFWHNHIFLPVYQQQQEQQSTEETDEWEELIPLEVVYTGVDINAVRNIDFKQGVFTADFYIWFRFEGVFDDTAITFLNARQPVTLENPVLDTTSDNITVRAYRVIADLTFDSGEETYPFDRHTLRISFRHDDRTRTGLIYVPDIIGLNGSIGKKNTGENMLENLHDWEISEIVSKQRLETVQDENRENVAYSRIDTEINIHRQDRGILSGKIMLPFLYVIILSYLLFYMSFDLIWIRAFIQLSLLILMVGIRILYGFFLPGQEIAQCMLYFTVVLISFSFLISGGSYWAHRYHYVRIGKCILYTGWFIYPVAAIAGVVYVMYSHSYTPWSSWIHAISVQYESMTWSVDNIREIIGALLR